MSEKMISRFRSIRNETWQLGASVAAHQVGSIADHTSIALPIQIKIAHLGSRCHPRRFDGFSLSAPRTREIRNGTCIMLGNNTTRINTQYNIIRIIHNTGRSAAYCLTLKNTHPSIHRVGPQEHGLPKTNFLCFIIVLPFR